MSAGICVSASDVIHLRMAKKNLEERSFDHEQIMQMVIELARNAAEAGELNNDCVEEVEDIERLLALALAVPVPTS